jgi:hypothetical protein
MAFELGLKLWVIFSQIGTRRSIFKMEGHHEAALPIGKVNWENL